MKKFEKELNEDLTKMINELMDELKFERFITNHTNINYYNIRKRRQKRDKPYQPGELAEIKSGLKKMMDKFKQVYDRL